MLLVGVIRVCFHHILKLGLTFIGFRFLIALPIFDASTIVVGDDIKDPSSALVIVEDVFLEVADSGLFGREKFLFRVVRDPPKCVSQIIVCSDRVPELIESVSDEAEEEFPMLLVLE